MIPPSCSCWTGSAQKRNVFFWKKGGKEKAERFKKKLREIYLSNQLRKEETRDQQVELLGEGGEAFMRRRRTSRGRRRRRSGNGGYGARSASSEDGGR